jgi:hypothetical protein
VDDSVAILVEPAEAALEEVLARLAGSPEELARRRAACRAFALEHFGEKNAGQLMAAYFGA